MHIPSAPRADEGIGPYKEITCVSTVGDDAETVRKDVHAYTVGLRGDVGIGPYGNIANSFRAKICAAPHPSRLR